MKESSAAEYRSKLDNLTRRLSNLHVEKGHWEASRNLFERKQSEHNTLIRDICEKWMEESAVELNVDQVEESLDRVIEHWETVMKQQLEEWSVKERNLYSQWSDKESEVCNTICCIIFFLNCFKAHKAHVQWKVIEHSWKELKAKMETLARTTDPNMDIHSLQLEWKETNSALESKQQSLEQLRANEVWSKWKNEREELESQIAKYRKRFSELCEERNNSKADEEMTSRYVLLTRQVKGYSHFVFLVANVSHVGLNIA